MNTCLAELELFLFVAVVLETQIGSIVTGKHLPFRTLFQFDLNLHPDLTHISHICLADFTNVCYDAETILIISHPAIPFYSDILHIEIGLLSCIYLNYKHCNINDISMPSVANCTLN
jgi:hypothetical protein